MKRKGGGNTPSTLQPLRESMPSNRSGHNLSSNRTLNTIIITSLVWVVILLIALLGIFRYVSSSNCPQNNLIQSKKKLIKILIKKKQTFRCFLWCWSCIN